MALKLITPPDTEPVETDPAKLTHMRVIDIGDKTLDAAETQYIQDLISVARETCEEHQNRAYLTQTWELWLDYWPPVLMVPRPPLQSVESIKWYDRDNQEYTIAPEDYFVDTMSEPGRIAPNPGKAWPSGIRPTSGICVTFVAGHTEAEKVPRRVRQAILLLAAEWYENREATTITGSASGDKYSKEMSFGVTRLLNYDRVTPV